MRKTEVYENAHSGFNLVRRGNSVLTTSPGKVYMPNFLFRIAALIISNDISSCVQKRLK